MVSSNEVSLNLRETRPLSRNILHSPRVRPWDDTGQRPNPNVISFQKGTEDGYFFFPSRKVVTGNPNYPDTGRDSAKSGLGFHDNHHLNNLAESISVNVGDFYQDVKVSSPPMTDRSVGGAVVVGARESRVHGKGR